MAMWIRHSVDFTFHKIYNIHSLKFSIVYHIFSGFIFSNLSTMKSMNDEYVNGSCLYKKCGFLFIAWTLDINHLWFFSIWKLWWLSFLLKILARFRFWQIAQRDIVWLDIRYIKDPNNLFYFYQLTMHLVSSNMLSRSLWNW